MNIKNATLSLALLLSGSLFAQESNQPYFKTETKISFLDSIKSTFVHDNIASCVDSLWMNELTNLDIYNDLASDLKNINIDDKVNYELPTEVLKARLKEMDAKSPFNIEYNQGLENIIKSFLKNRKKSFERLMAISEYYFPMFEEALAKKNIPLEIKYLAVVESALNPKAVSKMGATGLWQFMYQTGKQYNLLIDSYVDERSDPLKSSEAAAQYMTNMYRIFGDWDLVLASYNSGPGNVAKAIRRSGGQQNYWNIRKNLPKETQGYVPAFLATMYIYEYHKEHGIVPNRALVKHFETDTVMIKQKLTFKQISDLIDIPVAQLQLLNPSYKLNTVPFYADKAHFLRMPSEKVAVFTSNENQIYAYAQYESGKRERPFTSSQDAVAATITREFTSETKTKIVTKTKYHKVKRGENLGSVSNKYGVSISDLKKWNRLKSNNIGLGSNLKIVTTEKVAYKVAKEVKVPVETKTAVAEHTGNVNPKAVITSDKTQEFYVVKTGDNLSSIAKKHAVTIDELKEWNNLSDNTVKLESRIKIAQIINNDDRETIVLKEDAQPATPSYVVAKGDNLGNIAKKFNVSIADLKQWNDITDTSIAVGKKLIVSPKEIIASNVVAEKSPKKDKLAATSKKNQELYYVRKGDSLFSIAKKYPGVTISDIKKWNGIDGNNLKPGMKLKING